MGLADPHPAPEAREIGVSGTHSGTDRAVAISEQTDAQLLKELQESGIPRVRKLFREHDEVARDALVAIAKDAEAPAGSRVSASREILDRAYGKPETLRTARGADVASGGRGISITIRNFYAPEGDTQTVVDVEATPVEEEDVGGA